MFKLSRVFDKIKGVIFAERNCPTYLYEDEQKQYVSKISDGRLEDGRKFEDVTTVDNIDFAMNFQKYNFINKYFFLKKVNKITNMKFRWKKVITILPLTKE